jgi:hypothetical protein
MTSWHTVAVRLMWFVVFLGIMNVLWISGKVRQEVRYFSSWHSFHERVPSQCCVR